MKRLFCALAIVVSLGCGLKWPSFTIVIPDPPATNTTPPVVDPPVISPPQPVDPPEPEPEPLPPLQNLTVVIVDPDGTAIDLVECTISGATDSGDPETRRTNPHQKDGFLHFPVRGPVNIGCAAPGYFARAAELSPRPENQPIRMEPVAPKEPPKPTPCVELECVRRVAAAHRKLLEINTRESCTEFLGHVLAALGPDWGYVGKPRGQAQHTPKGFIAGERVGADGNRYVVTGVSHDAIKRRDGQVVDIVGNAAANEPCPDDVRARGECWKPGPASADWHVVPPQWWRPENPFVPATAVPR